MGGLVGGSKKNSYRIQTKKFNTFIMDKKNMGTRILIIDIETTGLQPQTGHIAEIGLVELDLSTGEKKILLDRVVHEKGMTKQEVENSWIVKNGYMTMEEIRTAPNLATIRGEIQFIIDGYPNGATAFNKAFDFGFLQSRGFLFPRILDCPMILSTDVCQLEPTEKMKKYKPYLKYKTPNVMEAYKHFFPNSKYVELHRGADDAFHEADIVLALYKEGKFTV